MVIIGIGYELTQANSRNRISNTDLGLLRKHCLK